MKKILLFLFITTFLYANKYEIYFKDMHLGTIKNLETIHDGYLIAKPNFLVKSILKYDNFLLYTKKPDKKYKNPKYKYDKHHILSILSMLHNTKPRYKKQTTKTSDIIIECKNDVCNYKKINKTNGKITYGTVVFNNNQLVRLDDKSSKIIIEKQNKN